MHTLLASSPSARSAVLWTTSVLLAACVLTVTSTVHSLVPARAIYSGGTADEPRIARDQSYASLVLEAWSADDAAHGQPAVHAEPYQVRAMPATRPPRPGCAVHAGQCVLASHVLCCSMMQTGRPCTAGSLGWTTPRRSQVSYSSTLARARRMCFSGGAPCRWPEWATSRWWRMSSVMLPGLRGPRAGKRRSA